MHAEYSASPSLPTPSKGLRACWEARRIECGLRGERMRKVRGHDSVEGPRPSSCHDPARRDPQDSDHHLLALWAASCAEHVLHLFEAVQPDDPRPRQAIEHARAWVRGEVKMMEARAAGGHAMGAPRELHRELRGAPRHGAYAAGQAGAVAH